MPDLPSPSPPSEDEAAHATAADASASGRTRLPQRLRRSLAALSLVGAVLVALPVAQLLRYQSAELDALTAGRTRLDPVARAVHVQRGLLAHRDVAAQVLGGSRRWNQNACCASARSTAAWPR